LLCAPAAGIIAAVKKDFGMSVGSSKTNNTLLPCKWERQIWASRMKSDESPGLAQSGHARLRIAAAQNDP